MKESVQVDLMVDPVREGDNYLLCSDGLSGMIEDPEIAQLLVSERDVDAVCARLIAVANEHGGVDNITALVARIEA
jgi:protein phosphatase